MTTSKFLKRIPLRHLPLRHLPLRHLPLRNLAFAVFLALSTWQGVARAQSVEDPYETFESQNDSVPRRQNSVYADRLSPRKKASFVQMEAVMGLSFTNFAGGSGDYSFAATGGYEAGLELILGRGVVQFETGLLYAERGVKESYKTSTSNGFGTTTTGWDVTYKNRYLEIPMLTRVNVLKTNDMNLYLHAGVVAALLEGSTGSIDNLQNYSLSSVSRTYYNGLTWVSTASGLSASNDTKSSFASSDFRWQIGLGTQIKLGSNVSWTLGADYERSFNSVSSSQPNGYSGSTAMDLRVESYGLRSGLNFSL